MKSKEKAKVFCKKLKYGQVDDPRIIFGIILSQDDVFLVLKTARKKHHIPIREILSIEDTDKEFQENYISNGGNNDN